jgi:hypothetical protein
MPYNASAGIAIATQSASNIFYPLTDHNRQPINFDYEIIERSARMADGTMRKFVVAKKMKIGTSWRDLPSGTFAPTTGSNSGYTMTVDGYKGGAWIKDFYDTNLFKPVYVRITHSQDTASANAASAFYPSPTASAYEVIQAFMTGLSYEVTKRYTFTDLVNITIDFTEI